MRPYDAPGVKLILSLHFISNYLVVKYRLRKRLTRQYPPPARTSHSPIFRYLSSQPRFLDQGHTVAGVVSGRNYRLANLEN